MPIGIAVDPGQGAGCQRSGLGPAAGRGFGGRALPAAGILGFGEVATWVVILLATGAFGYYTKSLGKPLFIVMLLIMIPLAITELGVDSWSASLMAGEMGKMGISGGWVLIYTSLIMMLLRFFAGHYQGDVQATKPVSSSGDWMRSVFSVFSRRGATA